MAGVSRQTFEDHPREHGPQLKASSFSQNAQSFVCLLADIDLEAAAGDPDSVPRSILFDGSEISLTVLLSFSVLALVFG